MEHKVIIEPLICGAVKAVVKTKHDVRLIIMQPAFDDETVTVPPRSIEIYGTKDLAALKAVLDKALETVVHWDENKNKS